MSTCGRLATGLLAGLLIPAVARPAATAEDQPAPDQVSAPAQPRSVDLRWVPWLGCWELADERVRETYLATEETPDRTDLVVCVAPSDNAAGVTLNTLIGEQRVLTQTIVADGQQRPISEPECRGWERAEWSRSGERLFASAEISCDNGPTRRVSGFALRAPGPAWIDIQVVEIEGRESIRVRRYRQTGRLERGSWPLSAETLIRSPAGAIHQGPLALTIEDVKEASGKVSQRAVEAALMEARASFDLNGRLLIELDEAGVPDDVIDVMVALSFPRRFAVERAATPAAAPAARLPVWVGPWDIWPLDDLQFWPSYYAPFGYGYWGYYDPWYYAGGGGGIIIVDPIRPSEHGRVVDGLGYTRIRPVEPASAGGHYGSGTGSASSAQSAGSVSSQGYSSGGGGAAGGGARTAQPR
jgi:hypothetical protein